MRTQGNLEDESPGTCEIICENISKSLHMPKRKKQQQRVVTEGEEGTNFFETFLICMKNENNGKTVTF